MNRNKLYRLVWARFGLVAWLVMSFLLTTTEMTQADPDTTKSPAPSPSSQSSKQNSTSAKTKNQAGLTGLNGAAQLSRWEKLRQQNADGNLPADGLVRAVAQARKMSSGGAKVSPDAAGVTPTSWAWLGPAGVGGRVRALAIDPTSPNTLYVGGAAGGVWKSTNGGSLWQNLSDFLPNMGVTSLVIDPTSPTTIYAGTGEGYFNQDAIQGAGILKSTDSGAHWTLLSSTANSVLFGFVNRLAISPNGATLLAATRYGILVSSNGGATWTQTYDSSQDDIFEVVFLRGSNSLAVASGSAGQLLYSGDGGQSWTPANAPPIGNSDPTDLYLNRIELGIGPLGSNIVYASANTGQSSTHAGQVWKSTDGGQNYTKVSANNVPNVLGEQGWYANSIVVDPTDANKVFWGGIDLYRSTDGGVNFNPISDGTQGPPYNNLSAHSNQHSITFPPNYDGQGVKRAYFTDDGGVFNTEDVNTVATTSGWVNLNNNLGITQFYGAAGNPTSGKVIAGSQGNGTLVYSGDLQNWTLTYGGDGGFAAADPTDPNYLYGEYDFLTIHRTTNGGGRLSSSYIYQGITDANLANPNANFVAPFILDPNTPTTMYAGGNSLWRSTNVKDPSPSWSNLNLPTPDTNCTLAAKPSCISAIAVAKGQPDSVWVGRSNGLLYYTANGTSATPAWTNLTANLPTGATGRSINRITIDPTNPAVVYVSLGGYQTSSGNLYKTTNSGASGSWTDVAGTGANRLPSVPIYTLAIHPQNSSWLYVGTPIGLFASTDGGTNWQVAPGDGPTNAPVNELSWVGNTTRLLAATHGRGVFIADIPNGTAGCPNPLSVTLSSDTGCGSLRYALLQATSGQTITISPTLSGPIVITNQLPPLNLGVSISGNCGPTSGPTITLNGNGLSSGLTLKGNNYLYGLTITGFIGPQVVVLAPTPATDKNRLKCVVVRKS